MRSQILGCALAAALLAAPVHLGGCAAALPIIAQVATVIAEVAGWVDLVQAQAEASDALSPDLKARLAAIRAVVARLNDAAKASPAAYAAAVAEFQRLWAELLVITGPLGVRPAAVDARLGAPAPGTVSVPTAGELGARLREAGPR